MNALRAKTRDVRDERGYTLQEVLTTVAIIGILVAVAVIVLLALLERWRVNAAIEQLAADMRLAHTRASNGLTDWRLVMTAGSRDYSLIELQAPYKDGSKFVPAAVETVERSLPRGTMLFSSTASPAATGPESGTRFFIEFNSDGTSYVVSGPNGNVVVSSDDTDPRRKLTYFSATSRIRVDP
jgi:prepilin-type N-terminal cleavage/methylation domain-containing protein